MVPILGDEAAVRRSPWPADWASIGETKGSHICWVHLGPGSATSFCADRPLVPTQGGPGGVKRSSLNSRSPLASEKTNGKVVERNLETSSFWEAEREWPAGSQGAKTRPKQT